MYIYGRNMSHRFFTIETDWRSCREAETHQSAEHDLCAVPPYDFPTAAVNLLPDLYSCVTAEARTKPMREGRRERKQEMREERGREEFSRCLQFGII